MRGPLALLLVAGCGSVDATFDEGVISGHLFATHCDSLDLPDP